MHVALCNAEVVRECVRNFAKMDVDCVFVSTGLLNFIVGCGEKCGRRVSVEVECGE